MKDLRSQTVDSNVEVRCITDCHVVGDITTDKNTSKKKLTLHSDNTDNNEVVVLFNPKYVDGVPHSLPEDILYFNVPNTAIVDDECVFLTDPMINEGNSQNPRFSMSSNAMTTNNLVDGFRTVDFIPTINNTGSIKPTNETIAPPFIDMKVHLESDSFIITRATADPRAASLESATVKLFINDTYVSTTRSSLECFKLGSNASKFGFNVRVTDPQVINTLKTNFENGISVKMLQTTEAPTTDNFRIPLWGQDTKYTVKYNGGTYVSEFSNYEPMWAGWGTKEFTTDMEIILESKSDSPLIAGDIKNVAGVMTLESKPRVMNDGESQSKYGFYLLPEPGSTTSKVTFKLPKEFISTIAKIMPNYFFENISDPNKVFRLVSNLSDTK